MRGEPGFAHGLVGGLGGFEVGRERDLGVHHDVLAPGQVDHHVGAQLPVAGGHRCLLVEVAAGAHSGQLDHAAQLHLAPAAPGLGPAQRGDQGLGLLFELVGAAPGDGHLLGQGGVRRGALRVRLAQLRLHPGQRLLQRPDQALHGGLAGLQFTRGPGVRGAEPPLGHLKEPAALASSACADSAWNRSASCPSTRAVRCSAARARSSAALARAARSAVAPASRLRATRKPMTAPSSTPMASVSSEIRGMSPYLQQAMTVPIRHAGRRSGGLPRVRPADGSRSPGLPGTPEPLASGVPARAGSRGACRVPRNPARSGRCDHFFSVMLTNSPEPVVATLSVPVKIVLATNCVLLFHDASL